MEGWVKTELGKELGFGPEFISYVVGFSAGLFYFYWTLTSRRGALERRDEVERYSSRPARENTGQRERAGEQRKRTIHLP